MMPVRAPCARGSEPLIEASCDDRRNRLRQHDRSDQARAQNAERDLLGARDRGVEDRAGIGDRGKADERGGVAGEHQHVTAGRPIEQREVETEADPERDGEGEQLGRVDEIGDQDHRHDGAQHRAADPIDRLRAGRAGERLDGDEDGADGPIGARQVDPQRDKQRQHGGTQDLEGEDPVAPGRHVHGTDRRHAGEPEGSPPGARVPTALRSGWTIATARASNSQDVPPISMSRILMRVPRTRRLLSHRKRLFPGGLDAIRSLRIGRMS